MSETSNTNNRKEYLDYMRVAATFLICLVHVAASNLGAFYFNENIWRVFNVYDTIGRTGLSVFVMISGALFLGRQVETKKIYKKYISRIVIVIIAWNIIYYLFGGTSPLAQIKELFGETKSAHLADMFRIHYHMWYLIMIIGIYMMLPVLKVIADNEKVARYFIAFSVIFNGIVPLIFNLISDFGSDNLKTVFDAIRWDYDQGLFFMPLGYMGAFILGYYLSKWDIEKKFRLVIYALGLAGILTTVLLEKALIFKTGELYLTYYDCLSIQVFMPSVAIFVFFKNIKLKSGKTYKFVAHLSKISFGAYLVHALLIEQFARVLGFNTLSCFATASGATALTVVFSTPFVALVVFVCAMLISEILSHIPLVKKIV